jgi:hypothetical protein
LSEAFERAGDSLREVLKLVEERRNQLDIGEQPDDLTVEFSLSFEVSGKAAVVPIFVTAESGLNTGLKITAVWHKREAT